MISLTRLDGKQLIVNCDHIITIEGVPDTLVTLTTGDHLLVKEPVEEVVERTVSFRNRRPIVVPPKVD